MDRGTRAFWLLFVGLMAASGYFTWNAEERRRAARATDAALVTGQVVALGRVVDGDSVVLTTAEGESVGARVLGIKAFETSPAHDPASRWGVHAVDALKQKLQEKPIRVMLATPPKDKAGRFLVTLYVDDEDVGLSLVKRGLALTYTVYPFPNMTEYLREQATAVTQRTGLWSDERVTTRANLLVKQWRRETE